MVVTMLQILGAFYLMFNVARYVSQDGNYSSQCFVGKYGLVLVLLFYLLFFSSSFFVLHMLLLECLLLSELISQTETKSFRTTYSYCLTLPASTSYLSSYPY